MEIFTSTETIVEIALFYLTTVMFVFMQKSETKTVRNNNLPNRKIENDDIFLSVICQIID